MKKYPLLSISLVFVIFMQLTSCSGEKYLSTSTPELIKTSTIQPTATQIDLPTKTATITLTDLPTKTATITLTETPFPIERDSDGIFLPRPIAFADTGEGAIQEIKDVDPFPFLDKIFEQVKNKLSITNDYDLEKASFIIVCEKSNRLYTIVRNKIDDKAYAVFMKNKDGQYISLVPNGELVLLPMKKEINDDKELTGFDVQGNLLFPPTFTYSSKNGEIIYTDPITSEQIVIKKESNTALKMLALLKAREVSISPEQILTDEQQTKKVNIENQLLLLGLPTDSYTLKFDGDVLIEEKSGDKTWYTNGFNFDYAMQKLQKNNNLVHTKYKPSKQFTETEEVAQKYTFPMMGEMIVKYNKENPRKTITRSETIWYSICLNPDTNSWGVVLKDKTKYFMVFELVENGIVWIDILPVDGKTIAFYYLRHK